MIGRYKKNKTYTISCKKNNNIHTQSATNISNKYDILNKIKNYIDIPDEILVKDLEKGDKIVYRVRLDIVSDPYESM